MLRPEVLNGKLPLFDTYTDPTVDKVIHRVFTRDMPPNQMEAGEATAQLYKSLGRPNPPIIIIDDNWAEAMGAIARRPYHVGADEMLELTARMLEQLPPGDVPGCRVEMQRAAVALRSSVMRSLRTRYASVTQTQRTVIDYLSEKAGLIAQTAIAASIVPQEREANGALTVIDRFYARGAYPIGESRGSGFSYSIPSYVIFTPYKPAI